MNILKPLTSTLYMDELCGIITISQYTSNCYQKYLKLLQKSGFSVVLTCVPIIKSEVEHLSIYLLTLQVFPFVTCLFISITHFLFIFFLSIYKIFWYILATMRCFTNWQEL